MKEGDNLIRMINEGKALAESTVLYQPDYWHWRLVLKASKN